MLTFLRCRMGICRKLILASAALNLFSSPTVAEEATQPLLTVSSRTRVSGYDGESYWNSDSEYPVWIIPIGTEILWKHQDGRLASWELIGTNLIWKIRYNLPPPPFPIPRIPLGSYNSSLYSQQGDQISIDNQMIVSHSFPGRDFPFAGVANVVGEEFYANIARASNRPGPNFTDIIWATATQIVAWEMVGSRVVRQHHVYNRSFLPVDARVCGMGRFNMDGYQDFFWQDPRGGLWVSLMNGLRIHGVYRLNNGTPVRPHWKLRGVSDFNSDGQLDMLFHGVDGRIAVCFMNGTGKVSSALLRRGQPVASGWEIVQVKPKFVDPPIIAGPGPSPIPTLPPNLPPRTNLVLVPVIPIPPTIPCITNFTPTPSL